MARTHGRNCRLYVGLASSAATATPTLYTAAWEFNATTDQAETTAWGDTGKTYVVGLPDAKGAFSGFFDVGAAQFFTAAQDGNARKFYFYPDSANTPTTYFFGTAFFSQSAQFSVSDANKITGDWTAATPVIAAGMT